MKRTVARLGAAIALAALLGGGSASAQPLPPVVQVSFYEVLSPYGSWVAVEGYGSAWRPYGHVVGLDFYPYLTGGHWEYTVHGWTWVSDWPWGWVPFHHGRWLFTDNWGWVWIPGDEWAPAWVEWRIGGGFVGWVPMPPPGVLVLYAWYAPRWCWVYGHHFHRFDLHRHRLSSARAEADAYHSASPVPRQAAQVPRGPAPDAVLKEGGVVAARPLELPRRLPQGAVQAERRISQTVPLAPERPALAPALPELPRREVMPPPAWRPPAESPAMPWRVAPPRPVQPAPLPTAPPLEAPEVLKKKQQRGLPPVLAPQPAPPPRRPLPSP